MDLKKPYQNFFLILLSSVLLLLPFNKPDLFFITWVGLIPYLFSLHNETPGKGFLKGWFLGAILLGITSHWLIFPLREFGGFSISFSIFLLLLFYLLLGSVYGLQAWVYLKITNKGFSSLLFALSWTGIEYLRNRVLIDFPFGFLGYTQAKFIYLLQFADIGGVFFISFVVVLINGLFFKILITKKVKKFLPVFLVFLLIYSYGLIKINYFNQSEFGTLKIGLVQTNINQKEKWKTDNIESNLNMLINKSREFDNVNLIIWPESSLTFDFIRNQYYRDMLLNEVKKIDSYLLAGSLSIGNKGKGIYNSSFLISPEGEILQRYNKMRLVPFGEYIPYANIVKLLTGYEMYSEKPGQELVIMELPIARWRTVICSEILHSWLVKRGINDSDFIINQSNEAWYLSGNLQQQMWNSAVFRAVEYRRSVVKAGNFAISGLINPSGIVSVSVPSRDHKNIVVKIKKNRSETIYYRWGDFIGYLSLGLTIFLLIKSVIYIKHFSR